MRREAIESFQNSVRDLADKICLEQVGEEDTELRKWFGFVNNNLISAMESLKFAEKRAIKNETESV